MELPEIEARLTTLVRQVEDQLPQEQSADMVALARAGEPGVALENLCTQLLEYDATVTEQVISELAVIGSAMGIDPRYWERLSHRFDVSGDDVTIEIRFDGQGDEWAMNLRTEPYLAQKSRWPSEGRHILAHHDEDTVVVYQAYRPSIGHFAAEHGYFGGEWGTGRMTWIKPNFLWMMYRSGWGTKEGQEVVLAVTLRRAAFEEILAMAVPSRFLPEQYETEEAWQRALKASSVRLQWDPDHTPTGGKVERRAIQLGLRGDATKRYAREWIASIEDISDFVAAQREHATPDRYAELVLPEEHVFEVRDPEVAARLEITPWRPRR